MTGPGQRERERLNRTHNVTMLKLVENILTVSISMLFLHSSFITSNSNMKLEFQTKKSLSKSQIEGWPGTVCVSGTEHLRV